MRGDYQCRVQQAIQTGLYDKSYYEATEHRIMYGLVGFNWPEPDPDPLELTDEEKWELLVTGRIRR